jgi:predicted nucleic acid-binding protein
MGQRFLIDTNILVPDAVIAATCLVNDFTLVTRNQKDFKGINGLRIPMVPGTLFHIHAG